MDEKQITEQLAQRAETVAPTKKFETGYPTEQPPEPTTVEAESGETPKEAIDPFVESQNKQTLKEYLDLTPGSYNALQADVPLGTILEFIHEEVGTDKAAILNYLRGVEQAIGSTLKTAPQRLNKLHQFVIVRQQARLLQKAQEGMLNG